MKKKLLSLALVLAMALTLMPTMAFAAVEETQAAVTISGTLTADDNTNPTKLTASVTVGVSNSTDNSTITDASVAKALSALSVQFKCKGANSALTGNKVDFASQLSEKTGTSATFSAELTLNAESENGAYTAEISYACNSGYVVDGGTGTVAATGSVTVAEPSQDVELTINPFTITMKEDKSALEVAFTAAGTGIQQNTVTAAKVALAGIDGDLDVASLTGTAGTGSVAYTGTIATTDAIKALTGNVTATLKLTVASGFTAANKTGTLAMGSGGDTKVDTTITITDTPAQVTGQAKIKLSFTITGTGLTKADIASVTATVDEGSPAAISATPTETAGTLTYSNVEVAVPSDTATGSVTVKLNATITDGKNFNTPSQATATVSYTKPGDEGKTPLALTAANFANGTLTITMTSEEFAKAANFSVVFEATTAGSTKSNSLQPSAFTAGAGSAAGTYTCNLPTAGYPTAAGTYTIKVTAVPTDTATYTNSTTVSAGTYEVSAAAAQAQPVKTTYDYKSGKVTWEMPAGAAAADRFGIFIYKANNVDFGAGIAHTEAYIADYDHDGCVQVTKNGGVYSATFKPKLSNGDYVLVVQNFDYGSMDGVKQLAFTISGGNSTTSVVIPSAGSVKTEADVTAAVNELASMPETALTQAVVGNTAKANAYEDLDAKAKEIKGITVNVVSSSAPDFIKDKASRIEVVGAALNASDTTVTLTFDKVSNSALTLPSGGSWDTSSAVKFRATPTNVASSSNLKTPIVITLPRPENMIAKNIVVLHYHTGSKTEFDVIYPKVTSTTVTFAVTGFSNFAIVEDTDVDNNDHNGSKNPGSGSSNGSSRPTNGGGSISGVTGITVIPNTPGTSSGIFTDVPSGHTFATQITWARDNNVMGGYSDGSFRPNANTNRQQLWMVLGRLAGSNPADMAAARTWAINAGISDGTNAQGAMSRQQLVTMLYRFAQSQGKTLTGSADLSSYPDSGAVASYAQEALAWAVGNGIVTGTSDGKLNPEGTASRAHFAVFLYRFSHMS